MQKIRWFFLIAATVVALVLALQNNGPVEIQLLFLQQSLPLSMLMLSSTAVGFLLGALMTASMLRKRKGKKAKSATSASTTPAASPSSENHPLTGSDPKTG